MQLPLFPYDLVLFPGLQVPLRFFEPRYTQMCDDVVGSTGEFGIVLSRPGSEFENEVPFGLGTVAHIAQHVRLPDGQWLVHTVGRARFRILQTGPRLPYLTADVELMEEEEGNDLRAFALRDSALRKLRRLFAFLTEAGEASLPVTVELSAEPGPASYELAGLLPVDNQVRQGLLEIEADDDRLAAEVVLLDSHIDEVQCRLGAG